MATDKVNISVHRLLIQPSDVVLLEDNGNAIGISRIVKDYDNGKAFKISYLRHNIFSIRIRSESPRKFRLNNNWLGGCSKH